MQADAVAAALAKAHRVEEAFVLSASRRAVGGSQAGGGAGVPLDAPDARRCDETRAPHLWRCHHAHRKGVLILADIFNPVSFF